MMSWKKATAVFLSGQFLSLLGSSLVQYALLWTVTLESGSGTMMALFTAAGFLPTLLVSPWAGVLADRHDRRKIIMLADGGIAVVTLGMAAVWGLTGGSLWLILAAAALRAIGQGIHQPAVGALLPQFVPADQLMRVNGIFGALQSANMILSPALAGVLLMVMPLQGIFLLDVGTALLAILLVGFFLKIPPHDRALSENPNSQWKDLLEGLRYLKSHHALVPFFSFLALVLILITPAAMLTPLQTIITYGKEVWRLSGIEMAFSLGMLVGGGLVALWGGWKNRMLTLITATLGMGLCTGALGLAPNFGIYLGIMGVFGVMLSFYNAPSMTLLQEQVESDYLGRMMSISTMLFSSLFPLSMMFYGPLAEVVSIETILLVTGGLLVGLCILGFFFRPLMRAGIPREPGPQAPKEGPADKKD